MKCLIFTGLLHPERAAVSLPVIDSPIVGEDGENIGTIKISIQVSQINVVLFCRELNVDLITLRNSIKPRIEALVDSYGFLTGRGYEVELHNVHDVESRHSVVFGVEINYLAKETVNEDKVKKLLELSAGIDGYYFSRALGLLRNAIRFPFETGFYCFLAIETLRNIYCLSQADGETVDRARGWELMRTDLGITKEYINSNIKAYADPIRHGAIHPVTEAQRKTCLSATWHIFDAYIERRAIRPLGVK